MCYDISLTSLASFAESWKIALSLVDFKSHFETDFFVIIRVTKEVIHIMRDRKKVA